MPDYRRFYVPGGTYFFTIKTERNAPVFACEKSINLLGNLIRETKEKWPFEVNAVVVLPDHLHSIWTLPTGDSDYSKRWGWLKKEFTKHYLELGGKEQPVSQSRLMNRNRGVWQRKFWEHVVSDEEDFQACFDYIHWNPVKHGYVKYPSEWRYSSFHNWVKTGVYKRNWGSDSQEQYSIRKVHQYAGE